MFIPLSSCSVRWITEYKKKTKTFVFCNEAEFYKNYDITC